MTAGETEVWRESRAQGSGPARPVLACVGSGGIRSNSRALLDRSSPIASILTLTSVLQPLGLPHPSSLVHHLSPSASLCSGPVPLPLGGGVGRPAIVHTLLHKAARPPGRSGAALWAHGTTLCPHSEPQTVGKGTGCGAPLSTAKVLCIGDPEQMHVHASIRISSSLHEKSVFIT